LLDLGGWKKLLGYPNSLTTDGDMLRALGLGEYEDRSMRPAAFHRLLSGRKAALELDEARFFKPLLSGMLRLGKTFHIDTVEQRILAFSTIIHGNPFLDSIGDTLGNLSSAEVIKVLGVVLHLPRVAVKKSLASDSHLSRSGLLRIDRQNGYELRNKLEVLDGIGDLLFDNSFRVAEFLAMYYSPAAKATLTLDDYPHLEAPIKDLLLYIKAARTTGLSGVNVLLYGLPGTGKTELTRSLAAALDCALYEVSCVDKEGDSIGGAERFRAYQLAQHCLARDPEALLLFDEVEDVFQDHNNPLVQMLQNTKGRSKGYTNRLLESNTIPTFWLTNNVASIDPAFKRRFDLVVEVPIPPQRVRRGIVEHHFGGLSVQGAWLDTLSRHNAISPAVLARSARVVRAMGIDGQQDIEQRLERLIGSHLRTQGLDDRIDMRPGQVTAYRPELINSDSPIEPLVAGLVRGQSGRICLYGPPGTGKSAFAAYIAEQMGQSLLLKRASDLLGPYVGQTEMQIRMMFREAREDAAVLLLDEADSFLRDRRQARQGWEVTQVNELLTQMETFEGVFICATNLVEDLDAAAARRFDFKLCFDALRADQCWELFRQVMVEQGCTDTSKAVWLPRLAMLDGLTPGDFAAVIRQGRILGELLSAVELFERLEAECDFRMQGKSRGIGFVAKVC
jgi:SpoVK/Ycf46/Vps4 family AAA+-type ATPase